MSFFNWRDQVLAANSSKEYTTKHCWKLYYYWLFFLSKLTHMKCDSFARAKNSVELGVFTWNDQVMGERSSKECTPKHFWQVFSFFNHFKVKRLLVLVNPVLRIDWYELCLLCESNWVLRWKCLYLERSGIGWKRTQRVFPEPFLTSLQIFYSFYFRRIFYPYLPNILSPLTHMSSASSSKLTEILEKAVFYWNK